MSRSTDPTLSARASFADDREIDAFVETLGRFERGEIDADAWRAYRVARGAYSQRQDGVHMLRIKLPQGATGAAQLRALADVAARFSRGYGHVTTRQNFQVHFVRPADLEPALRRLAEGRHHHLGRGRERGPQRGRLPARRRLAGRGVRRDALRRGGDAPLPAPPARERPAPQVQDRLRGLRARSRRDRDPRPRVPRARPRRGRAQRARVRGDGGGRDLLALHLRRAASSSSSPRRTSSRSPRRWSACSTRAATA